MYARMFVLYISLWQRGMVMADCQSIIINQSIKLLHCPFNDSANTPHNIDISLMQYCIMINTYCIDILSYRYASQIPTMKS